MLHKKVLNTHTKKLDREKYIEDTLNENSVGINAMSISELTGIPRATVVRKINNLIIKKLIFVDEKTLYP